MTYWPVGGITAGLAGYYLVRLVERTRRTSIPPSASGSTVLRYGRGFRILWAAGVASCLVMASVIAFAISMDRSDRVLSLLVVMLPMTAAFVFFGAEAFKREFVVTSQGIQTRSPMGTERFLAWADVVRVKYSFLNPGLVIVGSNRQRMRPSQYLDGIAAVLDALDRHLAPAIHERAAATILLVRRLTSA